MSKKLLLIGLIFSSLAVQSCNSEASKAVETQIMVEVAKPLKPVQEKIILEKSGGEVRFKGVSFSYNLQVFGEVEAEEIPELPLGGEDYKPDSVVPQHLLFKLKTSNSERQTEIYIFPIADYRRMYVVSKDMTKAFDDELKGLRKAIKDKNIRVKNQIPFIPFWDGSQTFLSKVKNFPFKSGRGIFFLTQFDIETSMINNDGLTYYFEGITSDEKFYILARFPVGVSFLPLGHTEKFEGYVVPERGFIKTDEELKEYKKYISKLSTRLENLPSDKYEPNLKYLEEIISSLKIEK